ncbi:MAG TPA: zinc-ribbon domain-containing protein, partial [Variovorax sp.]|nr:zinc-ribbon domain-containing protein [Variovorax sp.]
MSLVTRCPACATTFKVVRDQLRISDGWVRCGRCSHVFDATLDLHEAPDGPPAASAASPSASASASASAPAASTEPPSSSDAIEDADFFDDEPEDREPPQAGAAPSEAELVPAPE